MKSGGKTMKSTLNFRWDDFLFVCSVRVVDKRPGRRAASEDVQMVTIDQLGYPQVEGMCPSHGSGELTVRCDAPLKLNLQNVVGLFGLVKSLQVKNRGEKSAAGKPKGIGLRCHAAKTAPGAGKRRDNPHLNALHVEEGAEYVTKRR